MYSQLVTILKFFQLLGYIGALILAVMYAKLASLYTIESNYKTLFLVFLVLSVLLCVANYIGTQTIIVVIDLLNKIEINTRNSRQN
ncbi:hypothetical protein C7B62_09210 [Pleurocapsa sp. CCALA 161]|nr:hypothetical protein C7B62_09210 [Pleurocapsa sp. CCALA 161]